MTKEKVLELLAKNNSRKLPNNNKGEKTNGIREMTESMLQTSKQANK